MAGRAGNKTWLRQQLQKALQWDADAAETVAEAIAGAGSRDEVDSIVEAYTGGNATARQLITQFCGPARSGAAAAGMPPGMQVLQQQQAVPSQPTGQHRGGGRPGSSSGGGGGSGARGARDRPQTMELPSPEKPKPDLYLGPNVVVQTAKPRKARGAGAGGAGASAAPAGGAGAGQKELQKPVVNCLRCGKIHDCRELTDEARRFLDSGGLCSFCGQAVTLRYVDGTTNAPWEFPDTTSASTAAVASSSSSGTAGGSAGAGGSGAEAAGSKAEARQGSGPASVGYNDTAAAAVALKDRLVEYDREGAKRTTVYDDQADYFEIDANAWLTDEERAVLKQREREIAEAEEARRKKVTVSFDLLGRKVILEQDTERGQVQAVDGPEMEAALEAARGVSAMRSAAAATAAEAAQGGGAAAATALAAVQDKLRDLRITVNPSMAARHFVFLPPPAQQQQQQGGVQRQRQPTAAAAGAGAGGGRQGGGKVQAVQQQQRKQAAAKRPSRLQHDDPFELELAVAE